MALLPAVLMVLTLATGRVDGWHEAHLALLVVTACSIFTLLLRLYLAIGRSSYRNNLGVARLHLALHLVPLFFFALYLSGATPSWGPPVLVLLLTLFFASGRQAWKELANLFPSTLLYQLFKRGNAAFMTSFPLLYLASLTVPNFVTFSTIKSVALFYFSIHFMILGIACLKIRADLQSPEMQS